MLLKYFYDTELAQASYLVGCDATGEALVIDPARDITPYLQVAALENLRIRHVTETHIHADFVSGSRELAARTGAKIYLSAMGGEDGHYGYAREAGSHAAKVHLLQRGAKGRDRWMVGKIRVEILHTPGHTPEHLSFIITDTANADQPIGIFTGDFLFVGDVGRPDLQDEMSATTNSDKETSARQQFQSIERIKALPDYLQIWPGHGAGSACGKELGSIPSTTLGYEKRFNPAFQFTSDTVEPGEKGEAAFVQWLLSDQPEIPRYFSQMKQVNKVGPPLLATLHAPTRVEGHTILAGLNAGAMVFDLRCATAFRHNYLPGTINIPATSEKFSTYVGWFVDYAHPPYLIVPDVAEIEAILRSLRAIGIDEIAGFAGPDVLNSKSDTIPAMNAREVARIQTGERLILDVRGQSEYRQRHIAGALNIPLGYLPQHLDQLPHDKIIAVHCSTGYRAQIAGSLLRAHGFDNVVVLDDNMERLGKVLETDSGH